MQVQVPVLLDEAREMALELRLKDKLIAEQAQLIAQLQAEVTVRRAEVGELVQEMRTLSP